MLCQILTAFRAFWSKKMARINPTTSLRLGTFNCKTMGNGDQEKIKRIAHTIAESGAELVSLQEISSLDGLSALVDNLGNTWQEVHTEPVNNSRIPERMAFLYKKARIEAVDAFTFTPHEKSIYVGGGKVLTRAPGFARFIVDNSKDIVIVSVHTFQERPHYECRLLKKMIKAIKATNSCNNVIVLGDFNLPCNNRYAFEKLVGMGYTPVLSATKFTNLNNTDQYDNIWINKGVCILCEEGRVCRDTIPEGVPATEYSDHCMVVADISLASPISERARFFNPPSFEEGMKQPVYRRFRLGSLSCCNKSKIVCNCEY